MRQELRMKYLEVIYERYHKASKKSKSRILDEFCKICGYNRKYAICKLNRLPSERKPRTQIKRQRSTKYDRRVFKILERVWETANFPWSVRLKEIVQVWLPWIRKHFQISSEDEEKLLSISASTIDRHLHLGKRRLRRRLYSHTKPGKLLRQMIPVKCDHWDVQRPGFLEIDLVSHSGDSGSGEFIYSLNLTDIHTGWVETRAVVGKGETSILAALEEMSKALPFKILGIDSDNGSEFINHHLRRYCEAQGIQFTRSRPYKKDDNAHIEQKIWTHVRRLMGWERYDSPEALRAMNDLYANELPLFMNLFLPSVKLTKIIRKGSRRNRFYDKPRTPLDRLLVCKHSDLKKGGELKALRERTDPFLLSKRVNQKLQRVWDLAHYRYQPSKIKKKPADQDKSPSGEKEILKALSQIFGDNVYAQNRKEGELVAANYG